jgi:hypothetical protein
MEWGSHCQSVRPKKWSYPNRSSMPSVYTGFPAPKWCLELTRPIPYLHVATTDLAWQSPTSSNIPAAPIVVQDLLVSSLLHSSVLTVTDGLAPSAARHFALRAGLAADEQCKETPEYPGLGILLRAKGLLCCRCWSLSRDIPGWRSWKGGTGILHTRAQLAYVSKKEHNHARK